MVGEGLSPALPPGDGSLSLTNHEPRLLIEAESDGIGGSAPDVEASSSMESPPPSDVMTASSGETSLSMHPPADKQFLYPMFLTGFMIVGLLVFVWFIFKKHLNTN